MSHYQDRHPVSAPAKKFDENKIPKQLVCPHADDLRSLVFGFGAKKYGTFNFLQGGENWTHTRIVGATLRHLHAHLRGESIDPESGMPHLAHASCGLDMLMECWVLDAVRDDRSAVMKSKHVDTLGWLAQLAEREGRSVFNADTPTT